MAHQYARDNADERFSDAYRAIRSVEDNEVREGNYHVGEEYEATTGTTWVYSHFFRRRMHLGQKWLACDWLQATMLFARSLIKNDTTVQQHREQQHALERIRRKELLAGFKDFRDAVPSIKDMPVSSSAAGKLK